VERPLTFAELADPGFAHERFDHPTLAEFRREEGLDALLSGASGELERFTRLRSWTHRQWTDFSRHGAPEPYTNARLVLKLIRDGQLKGGLCSEHAAVYGQALLAAGHTARYVSLVSATGEGHRTVEVWSDEAQGWQLMDPTRDVHYSRDGRILSALDIHRALIAGEIAEIVAHPGRSEAAPLSLEQQLALYMNLTLILRNDHLSRGGQALNAESVGWTDAHTDGRPSFSASLTGDAAAFDWKANQVAAELGDFDAETGSVRVDLRSNAAGPYGFEARLSGSGDWSAVGSGIVWTLAPGANRLELRSRNVRGVASAPTAFEVVLE
jgi:hypothetical protein